MIEKIDIKYFKGIEDSLTLSLPNHANLLVCGENGSGKSSIFEALKMLFYRERLLKVSDELVGEERLARISDIKNSYDNKKTGKHFEISLNGVVCNEELAGSSLEVYMISCDNLKVHDIIALEDLLTDVYFPLFVQESIDFFWSAEFIEKVNNTLKVDFFEDVRLEILQDGDRHLFKIVDNNHYLKESQKLQQTFNEARLDIIILAIYFEIILYASSVSKKKVLILDDVINSLDMANRGLIARFILQKFQNFQCFIFTHNVSFFNLISYSVTNYKGNSRWVQKTMHEFKGKHYLSDKSYEDSAAKIKQAYHDHPDQVENIGNRIRKHFESLLYDYSFLLYLGNYEEVATLLEKLVNIDKKNIYFYKCGSTIFGVDNLLSRIEGIINNTPDDKVKERISKQLSNFTRNKDFVKLIPTLQDMKLFQKVTLHQLSHSQGGLSVFSSSEIEYCILLLEKIEEVVYGFKGMNGTGNLYTI